MPTELGRIRESYNADVDTSAGVYAGIVDAETKRNPSHLNDAGWLDNYQLIGSSYPGVFSWPTHDGNVYGSCDDDSPHPFCKDAAEANWTDNFRNIPLFAPVCS